MTGIEGTTTTQALPCFPEDAPKSTYTRAADLVGSVTQKVGEFYTDIKTTISSNIDAGQSYITGKATDAFEAVQPHFPKIAMGGAGVAAVAGLATAGVLYRKGDKKAAAIAAAAGIIPAVVLGSVNLYSALRA